MKVVRGCGLYTPRFMHLEWSNRTKSFSWLYSLTLDVECVSLLPYLGSRGFHHLAPRAVGKGK